MTVFTVVNPQAGLYIVSSGGQTYRAMGYALSLQIHGGELPFSCNFVHIRLSIFPHFRKTSFSADNKKRYFL